MNRPPRIEPLAVCFTAGVALGTLPGSSYPLALLSGLLLSLLLLSPRSDRLLPLLFLFTGVLCALTAAFGGPDAGPSLFERLALHSVQGVRSLIDSLPFPSPETAPVLKAFLTGDRSALPRETVAVFRAAGASHLLALSGLHIGVIYLVFRRIGGVFGNAPAVRVIRSVLTMTAAGFFTLMVGASPSIVRAFLFIVISETAALAGREKNSLKVLCLALFLQLAVQPSMIRSVGFQLSYAAMLGIFLLYPTLDSWYPAPGRPGPAILHPMRHIWQAAALSISCQAFTAPLAWHYFHSFPRYFLLTNLLALPLTTGIITLALATTVSALFFPGDPGGVSSVFLSGLPHLLLLTTDRAVSLLLEILQIIASPG